MRVGKTHIDFDLNQINGSAGKFFIEPKVMLVLSVLVDNAGQVVSRNELIDKVWGIGNGGDERLSRAISILRKSFGDTPGEHNYIQTIPRRGYMLIDDIQTSSNQQEGLSLELESGSSDKAIAGSRKWLYMSMLPVASLFVAIFLLKNIWAPMDPPLIIIMDSAFPSRVYDQETIDNGGTNADILSQILSDLPLRTQKELISPNWQRYEAMTQFAPDLILIHYSGFKQEDAGGNRRKLRLLIEYFKDSDTQFLIYSRASEPWMSDKVNSLLNASSGDQNLRNRIHIFPLLEYGNPHWQDISVALAIKLRIKEILGL